MRSFASRCLVAAVPLLLAVSACSVAGDTSAPTAPELGRGSKPGTGGALPLMAVSPTSLAVSVGGTTTIAVTYRDNQGNVVPETDMRLTYYGCYPIAPSGATCNDLLTITPVMPYLRQAQIRGVGRGEARLYASDGHGTYVYADLLIQ